MWRDFLERFFGQYIYCVLLRNKCIMEWNWFLNHFEPYFLNNNSFLKHITLSTTQLKKISSHPGRIKGPLALFFICWESTFFGGIINFILCIVSPFFLYFFWSRLIWMAPNKVHSLKKGGASCISNVHANTRQKPSLACHQGEVGLVKKTRIIRL